LSLLVILVRQVGKHTPHVQGVVRNYVISFDYLDLISYIS